MRISLLGSLVAALCTCTLASSSLADNDTTTSVAQKYVLEYGVGFSLYDRHGVASAWFTNGSTIDIAKIEGGNAYKQYLLSVSTDMHLLGPPREITPTCRILPGFLCRRWPSQPQPDSPLRPMLAELKAATEARSEEPLRMVHVSSPRSIRSYEGRQKLSDELQYALHKASLRTVRTGLWNDIYAVKTQVEDGVCEDPYFLYPETSNDPPAKIILAIENTRDSFSVAAIEEECGIYDAHRSLYDRQRGQHVMASCRASNNSDICDEEISRGLRSIIRPPEVLDEEFLQLAGWNAPAIQQRFSSQSIQQQLSYMERELRTQIWYAS
ncbi:Hypothetical protein D9617_11g008480 [Elsinoe fawcettii]|nr:Hypothetical protein D9617_11g008480 [Elsinoe fawcettii]